MRFIKKFIIGIAFVFFLVWGCSYAKCEIYTYLYGEQFRDGYKQTNMIGGTPTPKVIKYSQLYAEVYYVDEYGGDIIIFVKKEDKWDMIYWNTIWSSTGSASNVQWPYIWYFR